MTTNTKFVIATTDSCTLSMKGGNMPVLKAGTQVKLTLVSTGESITGKTGFSSPHMLCLAKGSAESKALAKLLEPKYVKGGNQEVAVEVVE